MGKYRQYVFEDPSKDPTRNLLTNFNILQDHAYTLTKDGIFTKKEILLPTMKMECGLPCSTKPYRPIMNISSLAKPGYSDNKFVYLEIIFLDDGDIASIKFLKGNTETR